MSARQWCGKIMPHLTSGSIGVIQHVFAEIALAAVGASGGRVALDVAMMLILGPGWREPGWYIGVAAAVAFRGRARIIVVGAVFALAGGYDVWRTTPQPVASRCGSWSARPPAVSRRPPSCWASSRATS